MFAKSGTCRFGDKCSFAHPATRQPKAPRAPKPPTGQPAAPAAPPPPADPALAAKGKGKGKKQLRKAA
eukprot:1473770-Heterocapsa_arctica.AAC.1